MVQMILSILVNGHIEEKLRAMDLMYKNKKEI